VYRRYTQLHKKETKEKKAQDRAAAAAAYEESGEKCMKKNGFLQSVRGDEVILKSC
jgi:hypothetical protein